VARFDPAANPHAHRPPLEPSHLGTDPIERVGRWFEEAVSSAAAQPDAMALATATPAGEPSVRMVLLKGIGPEGLLFYTHHESRKVRELTTNPRGALALYWVELHRQVRAEGTVNRISDAEAAAYFATRPRDAQLSAWASRQSRVIGSREELDARFAEADARFAGRDVPLPPFWGGYRLRPDVIEFWQGHPNRLHDRLVYRRRPEGGWVVERLQP
jgi:pyridoxamine 5'-phosphate oxidase